MHLSKLTSSLLLSVLLAGCAAQQTFQQGRQLLDAGEIEHGLAKMNEAYSLDPEKREYRSEYYSQRDSYAFQWLIKAEKAKREGNWDEAEKQYLRILKIDPDNARAKTALSMLPNEQQRMEKLQAARELFRQGLLTQAEQKIHEVLINAPSHPEALALKRGVEARRMADNKKNNVLVSILEKPISIEFKEARLSAVLSAVSNASGINFMLDKDVSQSLTVTLFVHDARIEDVLRFILTTNQLASRVLNQNTLYIYPDLPHKKHEFEELQIKNFYLTNASAKDVANMLKGLLKTRNVYVDERLNLVMLRETADVVKVAERLVAAQDMVDPEVMLDVEVLEVNSNALDNIGIQYPSQLSLSVVGADNTPGTVSLNELSNLNSDLVRATISDPGLVLSLLHQHGDSRLLANPKIRAKNREKAKIHIGEKLPVINTTTTSNGLVSQSVNYLDVGLKLDVEPVVHLDNDVGIKVALEVSSVTKTIQNQDGSLTYQIGTRNASTTLRLKDGETQILAGLINKEDRNSMSGVPGVSQLPIVGRLFSLNNESVNNTEIVLLITPRVIRNIVRPASPVEFFPSGTESSISLNRLDLSPVDRLPEMADESGYLPPKPGLPERADESGFLPPKPPVTVESLDNAGGADDEVASDAPAYAKVLLNAPDSMAINKTFIMDASLLTPQVASAELTLRYDPEALQLLNINQGELLKNAPAAGQLQQEIDTAEGRIVLKLERQQQLQHTGSMAGLLFQTLSLGETEVALEAASLRDAQGRSLTVSPLSASIRITPAE